MLITDALIEQARSREGGWSREQLMCIGVEWPPQKGWKKAAVGRSIQPTDADRFLKLKDEHLSKEWQ